MARYIDADKIEYTARVVGYDENAGYQSVALKREIDEMPTADVAPKSEVAMEIFAEIETSLMIESFHGSCVYYAIRAEDYLHYKKKYTEGETDGRQNIKE